jgi:ubiquinone/menaquinone biosynthesis C-methylase UbiE
MESRSRAVLGEVPALARIEEMGGRMATRQSEAAEAGRELKQQQRAMWALGDYHRFAKKTVWEVGPVLVAECGIGPGQRVLDVAAGTGNVALRAADAGADVTASDLTPENFAAGRREADELGVELAWVEADAEALPFDDGEFDVVTSSFGVMFAPDQRAAADQLLRVCRPGGTIGLASFTPEGLGGTFFELVGRHLPPAPHGAVPPTRWGSEAHVRELFGERVSTLEATRREYVERAATPAAYVELFTETFGPLVALRSALAGEPDRLAALERDLHDFALQENGGQAGGPAEYRYEYLLVVARRAVGGRT